MKTLDGLLDELGHISVEEIDAKIAELQQQVKSLQLVRKVAAARQGVPETPRAASGKPNGLTVRKEVRRLLLHAGPTPLESIVSQTGYSREIVLKALNSKHFTKQPDGRYKAL